MNDHVNRCLFRKIAHNVIAFSSSAILIVTLTFFTSCSSKGVESSVKEDTNAPNRDVTPRILLNEAPGSVTAFNEGGTIDTSNAVSGYFEAQYQGDNPNIKLQVQKSGGDMYTYDLIPNTGFQAFPFSDGNGQYTITLFSNISGDQYATLVSTNADVALESEFSPFLRPNDFVNYTANSNAISIAQQVCEGTKSDLGAIEKIFLYVVENIKYDHELAKTVKSGYVPNIDHVLEVKKGICFDYGSLTAAMLRSQGIPTKLVVGYAGKTYHAWISVYTKEHGFIANVIEFNGDKFTLMDPTFVASGDNSDPNAVGDGQNYNPAFYY